MYMTAQKQIFYIYYVLFGSPFLVKKNRKVVLKYPFTFLFKNFNPSL